MTTPLRILLIEDDINDVELLTHALKREGIGCELRQAASAPALQAALAESIPNVIICDFSLPQFDGFEALEMSGRTCPGIPFFFSSGMIDDDQARLALKRGATGYAEKGNPARLIEQIRGYADEQ